MRNILIIILLLTNIASFATIIEVKQDSTGDFTVIQEAMDFAQEGDTVLVWPGTYYEHLNFNGKGLTLASLMLTTGNNQYRYSTIIDGEKDRACITISSNEENVFIYGFTIQNGLAERAAGVLIKNSTVEIAYCVIKNNLSEESGAGGITCTGDLSHLTLRGNSIFNNQSYKGGGGISFAHDGEIHFSPSELNSVYSNNASRGCDILIGSSQPPLTIYLDTASVLQYDSYFIYSSDIYGYLVDNIELIAQNAVITPYDGDLYINPQTGSNSNSGTSWDQALKSITYANSLVYVDSLNKNTLYLANGLYSDTTNDEKFPINVRPYINVVGQSRSGTILDGNGRTMILKGNNLVTNYSFRQMTLQGSAKPDYIYNKDPRLLALLYTHNHGFLLDSIVFRDSYSDYYAGVLTYFNAAGSVVKNCKFVNTLGGYALRSKDGYASYRIDNCIFENHRPDWDHPNSISGIAFSGGSKPPGIGLMTNTLFTNNELSNFFISSIASEHIMYFANCTFANNAYHQMGGAKIIFGSEVTLYNCISFNEGNTPFYLDPGEWQQYLTSHLNIYNSLIEGGKGSVTFDPVCYHHDGVWCYLHYDSTNIDADPNFLGMWDHPYQIADGSPCINTGTLANLPDFIELPEFDLAGNPRIVGDSIDMGAYEWNETIVGFNEIGPGNRNEKPKLLKASPNPFDWGTYLSVEVEVEAEVEVEVEIEVYDNYGRLVRNILSTTLNEKQEILWYGDDNNGNPLPAGIYHVVMFSGEREVESLKVVKK